MQQQLEATQRQNELLKETLAQLSQVSRAKSLTRKTPGYGAAMGQTEKARQWLADHPNLDGLNQRDAARAAGVGRATLQRALAQRDG